MESVSTDHRSRVAAERRERTRARLVESAMRVFAEKGTASSAIQEVIAQAQVSQGTFYNYFRTNEELLIAVSQELNDDLILLIEASFGDLEDPAKRIACGVRLYLETAREYPLLSKFVSAAGLHTTSPTSLLYEFLPVHIAAGQRSGRFAQTPVEVALDLIAGTSLAAVGRIAAGQVPAGFIEETVMAILRGLGVPPAQASKLASIDLPLIEPAAGSLLARAKDAG